MTSPDVPDNERRRIFGSALPGAERYAALLAGDGVEHGHLGPGEVARVWSRHLVNSALITELIPFGARIVDVGSGAGLPGIPIALRRSDLTVALVEPLGKRVAFLERCVAELRLDDRVTTVRGRADDASTLDSLAPVDWVTARAVAPLDRLVKWCLPMLSIGGRLLALKGERAAAEVAAHSPAIERAGARVRMVTDVGMDEGGVYVARVVVIEKIGRRRAPANAGRR